MSGRRGRPRGRSGIRYLASFEMGRQSLQSHGYEGGLREIHDLECLDMGA